MARTYVTEEAFYYPHNLDFRGRAYPMHPSLNHLGADLSRGLLQFADAKPLGPRGLRWLEISVSPLRLFAVLHDVSPGPHSDLGGFVGVFVGDHKCELGCLYI